MMKICPREELEGGKPACPDTSAEDCRLCIEGAEQFDRDHPPVRGSGGRVIGREINTHDGIDIIFFNE